MHVHETTYMLGAYYNPTPIPHETVIDLPDFGWRLDPVKWADNQQEHLRVMLTKHPKAKNQQYLAFRFVKTSETPSLNGDVIMGALLPNLIRMVNELAEASPMYGEHDYEAPKIDYVQFRHRDLPGELIPLRNQVYRAVYD